MSQAKRIIVNTVPGDNSGDFPPLVTHDDYRIAAAQTVASLYSLADEYPEIQEYVDSYERHELYTLVLRGIVSRNMRSRWNNHNMGVPGGRLLEEDRLYYDGVGSLNHLISIRGALTIHERISSLFSGDTHVHEAVEAAYIKVISQYSDTFLLA